MRPGRACGIQRLQARLMHASAHARRAAPHAGEWECCLYFTSQYLHCLGCVEVTVTPPPRPLPILQVHYVLQLVCSPRHVQVRTVLVAVLVKFTRGYLLSA